MAHQTSKTSQKQSIPHSIGRLMDADLLRSILSRCIEIRSKHWRPRCDLNPCYRRERTTTIRKYNDLQEAGGHLSPC
jgi:hypothetical protein